MPSMIDPAGDETIVGARGEALNVDPMESPARLHFSRGRRLPLIRQSEAAECGLACLAMIAGYHGQHTELPVLRRRFSLSLKGITLAQLVEMAQSLGFASRPLRLELNELRQLQTPCILHWDLNHFVVLREVGKRGVVIHDPAVGERSLTFEELDKHLTGVAVELSQRAGFSAQAPRSAGIAAHPGRFHSGIGARAADHFRSGLGAGAVRPAGAAVPADGGGSGARRWRP
jgi:ATP-binding cassette, subfamily B, bacterial CvaB/MchF/RaxB